jgi:hypothetical protein
LFFITITDSPASIIAGARESLPIETDVPGSMKVDADTHVPPAARIDLAASTDGDADFHASADGHDRHPRWTEGHEAEND